jgi:excisionase family DNA binding protein
MKTASSNEIKNTRYTYYSVAQVANMYGIGVSTLRMMIKAGEIPFLKFRNRYVFRSDLLLQWENEQLQAVQ